MNKSENIKVQTRFTDIETCKASVDKIGRSRVFVTGSGKLYGEFEGNHFIITSSGKAYGFMEFEGDFVDLDHHIIMEGQIRKREDIKRIHKLIFFFTLAFSAVLFVSFNPIFMIMSVLFVLVSLLNFKIMDNNKSFKKMLLKKFTD